MSSSLYILSDTFYKFKQVKESMLVFHSSGGVCQQIKKYKCGNCYDQVFIINQMHMPNYTIDKLL